MGEAWRKVIEQRELDDDGCCTNCGDADDECECIVPDQASVEYKRLNGMLWGRKRNE